MPLVIVSGLPCSGKTVVSDKLKSYIDENYPSYKVCLLNDEGLGIKKQDAYKSRKPLQRLSLYFL